MKISTLITAFLLIAFAVSAQNTANLPKKANTIIISNNLVYSDNYREVSRLLIQSGYGIEYSDKDIGVITTGSKGIKNSEIKLNFLIDKNRITITGNFSTSVLEGVTGTSGTWMQIENKGMRGSLTRDAWNEMLSIGSDLSGTISALKK